jgi:hypothetical protein
LEIEKIYQQILFKKEKKDNLVKQLQNRIKDVYFIVSLETFLSGLSKQNIEAE